MSARNEIKCTECGSAMTVQHWKQISDGERAIHTCPHCGLVTWINADSLGTRSKSTRPELVRELREAIKLLAQTVGPRERWNLHTLVLVRRFILIDQRMGWGCFDDCFSGSKVPSEGGNHVGP